MSPSRSGSPRSVVPPAAGRSLWLSAVWTGAGAALVGAVVAIVAVAVLWLPAAGSAGSSGSALRAGLITFVASLHGGVTVDGLSTFAVAPDSLDRMAELYNGASITGNLVYAVPSATAADGTVTVRIGMFGDDVFFAAK